MSETVKPPARTTFPQDGISCDRKSPYYNAYWKDHVSVYLDSRKINNCITASAREGFVDIRIGDPERPNTVGIQRLFGQVSFRVVGAVNHGD